MLQVDQNESCDLIHGIILLFTGAVIGRAGAIGTAAESVGCAA